MRNSSFAVDYVHLLYYKCHKINLTCVGSFIVFTDWIRNKKEAINLSKKDNKCFQFTVTVTLNHEESKQYLQKIAKIKPFINQ